MVKQISVFLANQPGMLNKACEVLAREGIDIRALTVAENADYGLLRMIVEKPDRATAALNKAGLSSIVHEVLAVEVEDSPGGLCKITKPLTESGVNIEYVYAFVSRKAGRAYVVLRTDDLTKAKKILLKNGSRMLPEEEIESI